MNGGTHGSELRFKRAYGMFTNDAKEARYMGKALLNGGSPASLSVRYDIALSCNIRISYLSKLGVGTHDSLEQFYFENIKTLRQNDADALHGLGIKGTLNATAARQASLCGMLLV